ncbi:MAG: hypothetical protein H3C39_04385 [Flavobacteriia bacterium]|nr:hypothetical protein [Flavobacteriia bacterium]
MKRFFVILFLSAYLVSTAGFSQVLKLPTLIEHYFDHKQKDSELNFFDFLSMHYSSETEHHHSDKKNPHEKLPFQHMNNIASQVLILTETEESETDWNSTFVYRPKIRAISDFFSENELSFSIWQPPRNS